MKENEKDTRARGVKKFLKKKLVTFRSSGKRASEEGARRRFQPPFMVIISLKYSNASFGGTEARALGRRRLWRGFRQDREGRVLMKSQKCLS
jgi:hypothetical protein